MADKYKCAILGATGAVGQRFIQMLEGHPWFEVEALAASSRSAGKRYSEACKWMLEGDMPEEVARMKALDPANVKGADIAFSALPAEIAYDVEANLAKKIPVFSKAKSHRTDADVPVLVPEVNWEHMRLVDVQKKLRKTDGFITADPNCTTTQLLIALKPLEPYGIQSVIVTSMQALSGAGYPGVSGLDIEDNVLPFIRGEEEKVEYELNKVLGKLGKSSVTPAGIRVSASCNRVNVLDGHTECVVVGLRKSPGIGTIKKAMSQFKSKPQQLRLPTAPDQPLVVLNEECRPQPRKDRNRELGMSVTVGRVREDQVHSVKFVCVGHNTVRGAAGNGILNAEMFKALKVI